MKTIEERRKEKIEAIENNVALTPKQKEIELVIAKRHDITRIEARLLRIVSAFNEKAKQERHYHGDAYLDSICSDADNMIKFIASNKPGCSL